MIKLIKAIISNICFHEWEYTNKRHHWVIYRCGKYDIGEGFGLRYRRCTKCGKQQIYDDYLNDYMTLPK